MSARGRTLLVAHEPVVVPLTTSEGKLLTITNLLVIKPTRKVSFTSPFRLWFVADRDVVFGNAHGLTISSGQKSIAVSQTATILE